MQNAINKIYSGLYFTKTKITDKVKNISEEDKCIYNKVFKGALLFSILMAMFILLSNNSFNASYTIDTSGAETAFKKLFNDTYVIIIGVATSIAVCIVAINIVTIMTSKNQRKTEQAVTWIKAVAIAWFCLMVISLIIAAIQTDFMNPATNGSNAPIFTY